MGNKNLKEASVDTLYLMDCMDLNQMRQALVDGKELRIPMLTDQDKETTLGDVVVELLEKNHGMVAEQYYEQMSGHWQIRRKDRMDFTYDIHFKIVERENGNLDVYDGRGNLRWKDITRVGFTQCLTDIVLS